MHGLPPEDKDVKLISPEEMETLLFPYALEYNSVVVKMLEGYRVCFASLTNKRNLRPIKNTLKNLNSFTESK